MGSAYHESMDKLLSEREPVPASPALVFNLRSEPDEEEDDEEEDDTEEEEDDGFEDDGEDDDFEDDGTEDDGYSE